MILSNVADVIPGVLIRSDQFTENGTVLVLSLMNLKENNNLIFTEPRTVELNPQIENRLLQRGDIIIATAGFMKTICNMYKFDLPIKAIVSQNLTIIRPHDGQVDLYDKLNQYYYHLKLIVDNRRPGIIRLSRNRLLNFNLGE